MRRAWEDAFFCRIVSYAAYGLYDSTLIKYANALRVMRKSRTVPISCIECSCAVKRPVMDNRWDLHSSKHSRFWSLHGLAAEARGHHKVALASEVVDSTEMLYRIS